MSGQANTDASATPAIVTGAPLSAEAGLGALTIAGYVREVTARFAEREALVLHTPEGVVRWTYATLWERSVAVARALLTAGAGKASRVRCFRDHGPSQVHLPRTTGGGHSVLAMAACPGRRGRKVPRYVLFLRGDELSMTGSDKVRADALIQLAAARLRGLPLA